MASSRPHYLTFAEMTSADRSQSSTPCPYTGSSSAKPPTLRAVSERGISKSHSLEPGFQKQIRRLSRVRNFGKVPGSISGCLDVPSSKFVQAPLEGCRPLEQGDDEPQFEAIDLGYKPATPAIKSQDEDGEFQIVDNSNWREQVWLPSPTISGTEKSSENLQESQSQDQEFIVPKITFEGQDAQLFGISKPMVENTPGKKSEPVVPASESDIESLLSVSEPDSDDESWVHEPTTEELEDKLRVKDKQVKELSCRLSQSVPKTPLIAQEPPSKLSRAAHQIPQSKNNLERINGSSFPGPNFSKVGPNKAGVDSPDKISCYCQGEYEEDEIRVPLPILKIQIRNLRQQINEISDERKHYKETREKLQGQYYTTLNRKSESVSAQESETISRLRLEIASLEKARDDLRTNFDSLHAHYKEERKFHEEVNGSLSAKYKLLKKEYSQFRQQYHSALQAHADARQPENELRQSVNNLKHVVENMQEIQRARYEALEAQATLLSNQKPAVPKLPETLAANFKTATLATGPQARDDNKGDYKSLLKAYLKLEEEHYSIKEIRSEVEEMLSEQRLATTNARLEKRHLQKRIAELEQQISTSSSNPLSEPSSPSDTDTTYKIIARLNHTLTAENSRLTRKVESDVLIRDQQSEKINEQRQRLLRAQVVNGQLNSELEILGAAHEKLEKAHAIAQEAYKGLERRSSSSDSGGRTVSHVAQVPISSLDPKVAREEAVTERFRSSRAEEEGDKNPILLAGCSNARDAAPSKWPVHSTESMFVATARAENKGDVSQTHAVTGPNAPPANDTFAAMTQTGNGGDWKHYYAKSRTSAIPNLPTGSLLRHPLGGTAKGGGGGGTDRVANDGCCGGGGGDDDSGCRGWGY